MKDIFDNAKLGDLDLKSRIIRTGIWETQTHDGGFLDQEVYDRYDKIAKSGVGAITSEIFALDHRDRFYPYSTHMNYKGFFKDYKELTGGNIDEADEFIKSLNKSNKKVWIRQVIVPGIMDNDEYLTSLSNKLKTIKTYYKLQRFNKNF